MVQKHAARRLHFDFRLEWGGTLRSWAIPEGPSLDPAVKRLAVEVEDHPIDYADFEGVIPAGEYGAGPVIVWDRGVWTPVEDVASGLEKGKLLFDLHGYRLRGRFTLVRTKRRGATPERQKEWLLIKKPDGWAAAPEPLLAAESILSGLTLDELRAGRGPADAVRAELERLGAPRRAVAASEVSLMLAETAERPFSAAGWQFELKYDGFRLLVAREGGRARLAFRRGSDATATFPEVAAAVAALPCGDAVIDGEVVVLDDDGRPAFQRLQQRVQLAGPRDVARAAAAHPATYFAFDLLGFEGRDVRPLPLSARRELLRRLCPRAGPLRFSEHVEELGAPLYEEVRRRGLEGVMAKRADAPYRGGRRGDWLKVRAERTGDFVVVGWTAPKGARSGFGALHLAYAEPGGALVYAGKVGTGFSDRALGEIHRVLEAARVARAGCGGAVPRGREHHWVAPRLVCEVRYLTWTDDGLLRFPVFVRFRDDKAPEDCLRPASSAGESPEPHAAGPPPASTGERKVTLSNLDKVFWPEDGLKKGDLVAYYRDVAPYILPYLHDRPVMLTRYPDGITGKSFYQKDAPSWTPAWIRTERMWSEDAHRDVDQFVIDDVESLLYVVNLGTIPLHVWSSRAGALGRPDWCILDLDPKGAPFGHVVRVALALRRLCDDLRLPAFAKTSGSSGLHVLVPLGGQLTHEQSRAFGELVAHVVADELPEIATTARAIADRGGRVYVDYLQNGHGKVLAAPYCVRPVPGGQVSTPLRWSEVGARLDPRRHTLRTVPRRLARLGEDPLAPVLELRPDLTAALERLASRLGAKAAP